MHKILILTCGIVMTSLVVIAEDDTVVKTCANGAGTILVGKSGHEYCLSNKGMDWWNAYAWCDAQKRRLLDMNVDCGENLPSSCPEMSVGRDDLQYVWTQNIEGDGYAWRVWPTWGPKNKDVRKATGNRVLCY